MVEDAGEGVERGGERSGLCDAVEPRVENPEALVGDDGPVLRPPHPQKRLGAEVAERPRDGRLGEGQHLHRHRHRRAQPRHLFRRIDEDDEAGGEGGHHLLSRVRGAAPLDQVEGRVHLVGAVEGEVEGGSAERGAVEAEGVEPDDGDTVPPCQPLGCERRRHADYFQPLLAYAPAERSEGEGRRGAGAEPQPHPAFDEGGGSLAHSALRVVRGPW